VEDTAEQLSHEAKNHVIDVHGDLSIEIYGDKARLEQVMTNLLTNAIKYSPDASQIIVNIASDRDWLSVSVTDFGIGIPEEKIPFVFDRFFRVENTSQQFQGLGLGLHICKEIIRRHGGTINVESKLGCGSTFWFKLPLHALPDPE
jgi:signal transduction histidine kinase